MRISDWSSDVCSSDLSWGIRPVGASEPQPPSEGNFNQFFWLWTPCNFETSSLFFHSNDDGAGNPWNRRAVVVGDGGTERHFDAASFDIEWQAGSRRIAAMTADRKSTRLNSSH